MSPSQKIRLSAGQEVLADLGLIDLRETGTRKTLVPIAKYDGIEFALAA